MTQAKRQRAVNAHVRISNACCSIAALLLSAAVSAGLPRPATQEPLQAQEQKQAQSPVDAQTRGVAAQAATDAAASQVMPVMDAQEAPAGETITAGEGVMPHVVPAASPVAGMRGVLFRITPPPPAVLPAETMQAAGIVDATPPVTDPGAATSAHAPIATSPLAPPRASYLLATIHFGTPEEQGIDYAEIERTLADVETFVNEADVDEPWKPEYDGYRWLPTETPLTVMVGKDGFEKARALLPGVRPQDLDRMKPWSVLALLEARGESGGEATMDARLQRIAASSGKRVLHLESLEEQLQALDCVPAPEHVRVLDERLRASWILRVESAQAIAWYRARNLDAWLADIDRMEGLSDQAKAIEHRARLCLLEDRNARWIGQLETLFQEGPCLVAVGAVHLVGPSGLLAALQRDGYLVEAMPL